MSRNLIDKVESLIADYKKEHKGEAPFYIIMSPEDAEAITEEIRAASKQPKTDVITMYKDMKIVSHMHLLNDSIYVSNDLPETSS